MNPTTRPLPSRIVAAFLMAMLFAGTNLLGCAGEGKDEPRQVAASAGEGKGEPRQVAAKPGEEKDEPRRVVAQSNSLYGGTIHRNMVNRTDKNIPDSFSYDDEDKTKWKNIKWAIDLGSKAYGGPVIAGGKIFIGTNNDKPRDPAIEGDKGVMMCFRESDGKFLWQAVHNKLGDDDRDNGKQGVASSPAVDGDRLYYVSNRCELVCADVEGDQKTGKAKIIWTLDMMAKLNVDPCYLANCSPLIIGDLVYVVTGQGAAVKTGQVKNPEAPSFIAVDKKKGEVVWKDNSPGANIMEGQWSNPVAAEVRGEMQVIFPGGDGWLYSFEAKTGKLLWKFSCNPKAAKYQPGGRGDRCHIVATPVVDEDRLYVAVGLDPSGGAGVGHLWCIDITKMPKNKEKDLSPVDDNFDPKAEVNKDSALVWHYGGKIAPKPARGREFAFGRTISTVAVVDGLVYAAELDGYLQCIDAKTGQKYWENDMKEDMWASPYYVDGKVFIGTTGGDLYVFKHGKEKKALPKIKVEGEILVPVLAVNGVLYVNRGTQLIAVVPDKK